MRRSRKLLFCFGFNLLNLSTWIFYVELKFYFILFCFCLNKWSVIKLHNMYVLMTKQINIQNYIKHIFLLYKFQYFIENKLWFLYGVRVSYDAISYNAKFFRNPFTVGSNPSAAVDCLPNPADNSKEVLIWHEKGWSKSVLVYALHSLENRPRPCPISGVCAKYVCMYMSLIIRKMLELLKIICAQILVNNNTMKI